MKFLVIGNAVQEAVRREEDGNCRYHTGGVGAIMARELALAGSEVTFLTTAPAGAPTKRIKDRMGQYGASCRIVPGDPPQQNESKVTIHVSHGRPVRATGQWARMGGLREHIEELAPKHDYTLTSMNPRLEDLKEALERSNRLITNATTNRLAKTLPELKGQYAATMNQAECQSVMQALSQGQPEHLPNHMGAQLVMVTQGAQGKTILKPDEPPSHTPAPTPQKNTDFVGAGDAATAGLAYALAHDLNIHETVDRFVTSLMERNAQGYR